MEIKQITLKHDGDLKNIEQQNGCPEQVLHYEILFY